MPKETLITTQDMATIFGVVPMSIFRWRQTAGLDEAVVTIPGTSQNAIRFDLVKVLKWASKNNKEMPNLEQWKKDRSIEV